MIRQSMQLEWSGLWAGSCWLVKVTVAFRPPFSAAIPTSTAFESWLGREPQAKSRGVSWRRRAKRLAYAWYRRWLTAAKYRTRSPRTRRASARPARRGVIDTTPRRGCRCALPPWDPGAGGCGRGGVGLVPRPEPDGPEPDGPEPDGPDPAWPGPLWPEAGGLEPWPGPVWPEPGRLDPG